MRTIVEEPCEPHGGPPATGYRLELHDCFHCWHDLHVYVPVGPMTLVTVDVPCPHCRKWQAEILLPAVRKPIVVRACQRTELAWLQRRVLRRMRTLRAYLRIGMTWPYWALHRLRTRAWRRAQVRSSENAPRDMREKGASELEEKS